MKLIKDMTPTPDNQEIIYNALLDKILTACYTPSNNGG
jgi:hypothetical protein